MPLGDARERLELIPRSFSEQVRATHYKLD
jgi:hypothetical protein